MKLNPILLFALEKSVPSPACGRALTGEVTLVSMQAIFYQLTSNNSLKSHVACFCVQLLRTFFFFF